MKKINLIALAVLITSCSGIAPEAVRNENNPLLKPPFMKTKGAEPIKKPVVELYTKPTCNYCINAKNLLDLKKIQYTEYDVSKNASFSKEAIERSGGRHTVPQIFINGKYIGGYGELRSLNDEGKLEGMLSE